MSDAEIERKFLVPDPTALGDLGEGTAIEQGYLVSEPDRSLRVRVTPDGSTLTFKGPREGSVRPESETDVPDEMARQLLELCADRVVIKTRHVVEHGERRWEVDVFDDANDGLVVAEIELDTPDEPLEVPPWCGPEVTDDDRYYNQRLAEHPVSAWGDDAPTVRSG